MLFAAADVDNAGYLDFNKFVAACLYERLAPLDNWLAEQTFAALDRDNDGWLSGQEVARAFGGFVPSGLPSFRSFSLQEWLACLQPMMQSHVSPAPQSKTVDFDVSARGEQKSCALALMQGGLLSGCVMKRSHRRQRSEFEIPEDDSLSSIFVPQDNSYTPYMYHQQAQPVLHNASTCSQEVVMMNQLYGYGSGLSSPSYMPQIRN
eukprot:TRINITY_DN3509_c0_g1_i2.p1 TRINITY_DN3509_c0_g1~~TRINITY_DN3509_c0_g1_i2.p1  ORF type:complete len:206 (+),score=41.02 TRINITY_DN3509_c0_g1_i2:475-1092(+)